MLLKRAWAWLLVPAVPLATCFACSDGGTATPVDASLEAAPLGDARTDRRETAADLDGGPDAPFDVDRSWLTGEWDPVPGATPRCDMLIAKNPARDVTPIKWKPCPSGRAGCQVQDIDFTTRLDATTIVILNREPVRIGPGGKPYVLFRRWYPRPDLQAAEHMMVVVQPLDGTPAFAAASPLTPGTDCFDYANLSATGPVHDVSWLSRASTTHRQAAWTAIDSFATVEASARATLGPQGTSMASDTSILVFTVPDGTVFVNRGTGAVTVPRDGNGIRVYFDTARELPDGFLAHATSVPDPVYVHSDGTFAKLLSAPPGRLVSGYAVDRTQANALVWVEADGILPSTNSVLYTSPFATTAAGLVPRRVTATDDPSGGGYMIVANGLALNRVSTSRMLLTRLSDGVSWAIDADPGTGFSEGIWADENEVWVLGGKRYSNGDVLEHGFVRFARSSLGPEIPAR